MLSGISLTCFVASYSVSLLLEITRFFFRSGVRGTVMLGFALAGLGAQTAYLYHRATTTTGSPLSSEHDWYLLAAWLLAALYLLLAYRYPKTPFGLFLLPLVLGLVAVAAFAADRHPYAQEPASRVWGFIHGTSVLLATVTVLFGFLAGIMYLWQGYRLKRKLPPHGALRLPSLEWLHRASSHVVLTSALLLGTGLLSGAILNAIRSGGALPWNDPIVLSTQVMFLWLAISAAVSIFYKPARQGRKIAYLTLTSFFLLVLALGFGLILGTRHGGSRSAGVGDRGPAEEAVGSGQWALGSETRNVLTPAPWHRIPGQQGDAS